MQSMKGATQLLGSMNRQMNLPALQKIAMDFERENDIMDQRQEIFEDATDDMMGLDEEEESDEVVNQVLDEIGVDLGQSVSTPLHLCSFRQVLTLFSWEKHHLASRVPWPTVVWLRLLVVVMPKMMTCKHVLIVCADDVRVHKGASRAFEWAALSLVFRSARERTASTGSTGTSVCTFSNTPVIIDIPGYDWSIGYR